MSWEILAVVALILLGLEMLVPFTVFLWMGIGVGAASLASHLGVAWPGQVLVFLIGTAGSIAMYFIRRRRRPPPPRDVSDPAGVLLGLRGTAMGPIAPTGRVTVADGSWAARALGNEAIPDGAAIVVVGHQGATLLVEEASAPD
ncbi:NfeD family protein [Roseococcus sp. YIM B11640]|uniref:NfeD family protein n=1 Tax=Roseococcus sp. YIM B11640 TaxID=3133973 RepID=UPI003C7B5645